MAEPVTRTMPEAVPAEAAALPAFLAGIGRAVRHQRAKRGMTRRQLAHASQTSERYLAQIEAGTANPSVSVLRAIALALDLPAAALLAKEDERHTARGGVLALLQELPANELAALGEDIEERLAQARHADRAWRVALVGLRGAGKTTLGRMLAQQTGWPFVELDRLVEADYGASIPDLIEMAGTATFRRHERAALERVIGTHRRAIIAAAGGIVSDAETYALLLHRTHTVWLKAAPEDHMRRVMAQGDFRPMAQNRQAMADLLAILDARRADYARAEAAVDTAGQTVAESLASLSGVLERLLPGPLQTPQGRTANPAGGTGRRRGGP